MKLKNSKKGFTLVELVIVIAVIAILAAVLIPTFGSVINNANRSAARSEAYNLQIAIMAESKGDFDGYCEGLLVDAETERNYEDAKNFIIGEETFDDFVDAKSVDDVLVTVISDTDGYYITYTTAKNCVVKIYANAIYVDGKTE